MHKTKKKFLKLPEYPGGKEAFQKYIKANLVYPREALTRRVEGIVHLFANINDNGDVIDAGIDKGIGAGCDEEALRLLKNVRFGSVKNRGVRLKTRKRFRIEFKLPHKKHVSYTVITEKNATASESGRQTKKYSYTIKIT